MGPRGVHRDGLQGAGHGFGVTRELHRGRIRQVLALARHRGLDPAAEKQPDVAHGHDHQGQHHHGAGVAVARARTVAHAAQHAAPDQADHQDAEQHTDQADVQAHVAIEHVAELVRDDRLQFGPAEALQRTLGDRDGGITGREASGERVDAGLAFEHVDLGHWQARRDRDLLHHVDQAPLQRVPGGRVHLRAAEFAGDLATAGAEPGGAEQAADRDHAHGGQRTPGQQRDVGLQRGKHGQRAGGRFATLAEQEQQRKVHHQHDAEHRQGEQDQQPARGAPGLVLVAEKVHPG